MKTILSSFGIHLPDEEKKITFAMHSHKISTPTGTPVPDEKVKELSSSIWFPHRFSILIQNVTPKAHWACTGVSGGWGESSLQEFDYNHETKSQVFMQINEF